jgi:hypothetical protein
MGRGKIEARIVHQSAKFLPCKKLMWRKNLIQDHPQRKPNESADTSSNISTRPQLTTYRHEYRINA